MICEACNQNVATVHLTEIVNKTKKELHLCEECARSKGVSVKSQFSVSDLLGNLVNQSMQQKEPQQLPGVTCEVCGITFAEFRSCGRLGCANDYTAFKKGLLPLIEKIHGHTQHSGKVPRSVGRRLQRQKELTTLRDDLAKAIQKEEYERAAELRDRIYELEERKNGLK